MVEIKRVSLAQAQDDAVPVCNIVTPVGMLGYGFNEEETAQVLGGFAGSHVPTALILDSGSTDSGPSKLALGAMSCPRQSYVRDLTKLTRLVRRFKVPLIFSSAGGDGSDDHVRDMVEVLREIVMGEGNEHDQLKIIAIFSEVSKTLVLQRLRNGAISGCGKVVPPLTEKDVESTPRIVSQMGPEPFIDAIEANPDFDIIVGGRAYDPSPYVAFAAYASEAQHRDTKSLDGQLLWGGFTHMGKIMECGGQCATPKSSGSTATVYSDGTFDISPHDPAARCTPTSVAAHTLYEKTRPDLLYGPGGHLDLSASKYEQLKDGRTCRVQGGLFHFSRDAGQPYQVKLEAATTIGHRSMFMGSIKDPILIDQIDWFIDERVKRYVQKQHQKTEGEWELDFHKYGQHQVSTLPGQIGYPAEVFLIGEALGSTPELAKSVASTARIAMAHGGYPNQKATSGNLAWGIGGKTEIELGPCAEFSIYHLMDLEEGEERLSSTDPLFKQTVHVLGKEKENGLANDDLETTDKETEQKAQTHNNNNNTATTNSAQPKTNGSHKHNTMTLGDIALFIRSKNAGPYEITFDVVFETEEIYRMVKKADILNKSAVAILLEQKEDDIIWIGFFDQAQAFKVTIPRLRKRKVVPNGSFMEADIWAAQKYLPLMRMTLPDSFVLLWDEYRADKKMSEEMVRSDSCQE